MEQPLIGTLYGTTTNGQEVHSHCLKNKNGMEVQCIDYGCRITGVRLPGGEGGPVDVVLGLDDLTGYEADTGQMGAFVGRYAGRIPGDTIEVDGEKYKLTAKAGGHYLHGSMDHCVFEAEEVGENCICFTTISPDGEDGFPGELWVGVTYTLTDQNELIMDVRAVSKADTRVNFTNHSYFNLAGHDAGDATAQTLQLCCSALLEGDAGLMPTGRLVETAGGVFDFSAPKPIGRDIEADDPQLKLAGGYDHCFVIDRESDRGLALAAIATDPASGRSLRVYTTQPGLVVYTANFLDGSLKGKGGAPLVHRGGYCLEACHFLDSVADAEYPTTLLEAGDKYHSTTVFRFGF